MKSFRFLFFAVFSALLTACSNNNFKQTDLPAVIYQGYWAMLPVDDLHLVVKFHPNGTIKVYDYLCENHHYRLTETQNYILRKTQAKRFTLLNQKHQPFAFFDILSLDKSQLQIRQIFLDKSIVPNSYQLRYHNVAGAKPFC